MLPPEERTGQGGKARAVCAGYTNLDAQRDGVVFLAGPQQGSRATLGCGREERGFLMPYLVEPPPITYHHCPLFVIAANREEGFHHKLFQIRVVSGANPSLAVDFPYSPFESGIALRAQWSPADPDQRTFQWLDPSTSMKTSQRPKYNHHRDGRAHFSQDGKVRTTIARQACPLREINGHAFTVHVQGIERFPELGEKDLVQT
jgi:hypothetical protein